MGTPLPGFEATGPRQRHVDNLTSPPVAGLPGPASGQHLQADLADGEQATASATMDANGVVTGVDIANPGSGYTKAPTVTITDASKTAPEQEATVEATIGVDPDRRHRRRSGL